MVDERERCPLCGAPWTLEGGQVHMMGGLYCVRSQLTQVKKQLQQALAREARLWRVVEAAIAARDAFRLYDNPEKWNKAIAKLARVVEDLGILPRAEADHTGQGEGGGRMRGIICESCREEIDPIVPFIELRPNGLTAFMRAKDLTPKWFCSFQCLAEWAKRQSGGEG